MKQKGNILKTYRKFVSWILFLSFAFVFFCSAGMINCPKTGFGYVGDIVEVQNDFTFPCHNNSSSDNEESSDQTNQCQCLEDSKNQEIIHELTISKLLQISFYILFYTPSTEPNLVLSENQKHWESFLAFEDDFQIQQKTIKLLI